MTADTAKPCTDDAVLGEILFIVDSDPLNTTDNLQDIQWDGEHLYGPFGCSLCYLPIRPGSVKIKEKNCEGQSPYPKKRKTRQTLCDDGNGNLIGDGEGHVNYNDGSVKIKFKKPLKKFNIVVADYRFNTEYP